jgi:hypothetical protein
MLTNYAGYRKSHQGRYIGGVRDNGFSKNKSDCESGITLVTLSRSEGSVAFGHEMLRCGSA